MRRLTRFLLFHWLGDGYWCVRPEMQTLRAEKDELARPNVMLLA